MLLGILGEALVANRSLESVRVPETRGELAELSQTEEDWVISFMRMMPQMNNITCIWYLFDFLTWERTTQALVEALKENTVLKKIEATYMKGHESNWYRYSSDHVCGDATVQFYLQLNRLGRHNYQSAASRMNDAVLPGALPFFFSRMSDPEYASHLYHFIRHETSPDLLMMGQQKSSSGRKRAAAAMSNRASSERHT